MSHASPRVVIVGAGVGGLSLAIALKQQLNFENFTIFEKAHGVGGTWRDNIYPGCSSDIGVHFYSLSTDLKPDWTCSHPFQPEIETYYQQVSQRHGLQPHLRFGTRVVKAVWDPALHLYHITTEDIKTGKQTTTDAEVLISAIGLLEIPRYPDIQGLSNFQGIVFHSARWRKDVDLSGKKVAVIGNGASATQFVPIIAKTTGIQVTQFIRTPNWVFPPIRQYYSSLRIFAFRYVPFYQRFVRFLQYLRTDFNYFVLFKYRFTNRLLSTVLNRYMRHAAPKKYHKQLTPDYELGCKRVIFDTDYFSALHKENVSLNWDGVSSVTDNAIVTKQGASLPFDVIILATGYTSDKYPLIVQGTEGKSIQDYYDQQGGPTAYLGTSIPGFPNFYTIGGPNTATGHTSVIFTEECQVTYVIKLIKPILQKKLSVVDVSTSATDKYNGMIQSRLSRSVFVSCNSWYRVDGKGKVNSIFPGSATLFWWLLRKPVWKDYDVVKCGSPARK